MTGLDLNNELKECKKSARAGYKIAATQERYLSRALSTAENRVQNAIINFNSSPFYAPETAEILERQLSDINRDFNRLSFAFKEDLTNLRENLSQFSITLFGRTQSGKSTLMEILTEGDGSSIGKGAQRTTLDVRSYSWNGLEITDVPGFGAYKGDEDGQIALEAAKPADLVLFLITDDAPQAVDAAFFSEIVALGKPIIGIINVKKGVLKNKSLRFNLKQIGNRFDLERLTAIKKQFFQFGEQYGQTWTHIPFIYVHLQSAFISQITNDKEASKKYYQISRIEYLEKQIIDQVKGKGKFYRIKTFIDIISNPLLNSMENLLEQSQVNSIQGRTILAKKRKLEEWKNSFYSDGKSAIHSFILKIKSDLDDEIASFAEEHYDDKNADKAWDKILESRGVETRCTEFIEDLEYNCNDKLKEISREITNELKFSTSFAGDKSLRMHKIIDGKQKWEWGTLAVAGGLYIGAYISSLFGMAITGPMGWAAIGVTILGATVSFFMKTRNKKIDEARMQLERKLKKDVTRGCNKLQTEMEAKLDILISDKVEKIIEEITSVDSVVFDLADTQKDLAWGLNAHVMELNKQLMYEALHLVGAEELQYLVQAVARIPGNMSMILLNEGTVFPEEQRNNLQQLMSERIRFIHKTENKRVLISRVLGRDIERDKITIEEKIGIAHVPLRDVTPYIKNRVRLAQQFSELLIMNQ